jgi:4-hydroxy-tetrahydrodipicolinate reductase
MTERPDAYRVVQWGTGNVGRLALRAIVGHPRLELAGVIVHSDAKDGVDAAELCGLEVPTGVLATTDVDEALDAAPDAVSYMATGDLRPKEAVDDLCRVLAAGIDVVSTAVVPLVFPPAAEKRAVAKLEAACNTGGTSCFTSGIDPGFANDLLPLTLTGFCSTIESVRIAEILNYDTYDQPDVLFGMFGFGQPLDAAPLLLAPGVLSMTWGPTVRLLAAELGVELEDLREVHERIPAPETFEIPSGTIAAGTSAALRFEVQGIVGGRPAIVIEHVTRLRDDLAPEWPAPPSGGGYRIEITGDPTWRCELGMVGADGDHNSGGLLATAMRLLNAIPAVCAAPPGLLVPSDLPLITGRGLLR